MKTLLAALALAAASLAACVADDSLPDTEELEQAEQAVTIADLTGRWAFVYDAERRAVVEAQIDAEVSDPAERTAAYAEAAREASVSEIELTADGVYISRIDGVEIFRAPPLEVERVEGRTLFSKPMLGGKLPSVAFTLRDDDTLVMSDPKKGGLTFRRVR